MKATTLLSLLLLLQTHLSPQCVSSFQINTPILRPSDIRTRPSGVAVTPSSFPKHAGTRLNLSSPSGDEMDTINLKAELTAYLKVREEKKADEEAKNRVGKIVGGTRGNVILDFVSGSPNKPFAIEEEANVFDYDELIKYGFSRLVPVIMNAGGRRALYELMDLPAPPPPRRIKPKTAPKLVIDKSGETDKARYSGLKVMQTLDDDEMGRALEENKRKKREGQERSKIMEENFVLPFADNPNKGPQWVPDVTPEMLDEEGRRSGRAIAWARKARAGEFRKDEYEALTIEGNARLYCVFCTVLVSLAFGRSTPEAFHSLGLDDGILSVMRAPAAVAALAAFGSAAVAGFVIAPEKKRNPFVWFIKGFAGGPVTIFQLKEINALEIRGEGN